MSAAVNGGCWVYWSFAGTGGRWLVHLRRDERGDADLLRHRRAGRPGGRAPAGPASTRRSTSSVLLSQPATAQAPGSWTSPPATTPSPVSPASTPPPATTWPAAGARSTRPSSSGPWPRRHTNTRYAQPFRGRQPARLAAPESFRGRGQPNRKRPVSSASRDCRPDRASSRSAQRHRVQPGVDAEPAQRLGLPRPGLVAHPGQPGELGVAAQRPGRRASARPGWWSPRRRRRTRRPSPGRSRGRGPTDAYQSRGTPSGPPQRWVTSDARRVPGTARRSDRRSAANTAGSRSNSGRDAPSRSGTARRGRRTRTGRPRCAARR